MKQLLFLIAMFLVIFSTPGSADAQGCVAIRGSSSCTIHQSGVHPDGLDFFYQLPLF